MELRSGHRPRPRLTHAVFDWDGTLSFIRAGWAEVMLDQWMDLLPALPGETAEARRIKAHDDIWGLNGKPSIHQAARLSERIRERGGAVQDAQELEHGYQRKLGEVVGGRIAAIRSGAASREAWLVTGARAVVEALASRGLVSHVVSGTQRRFVADEAEVLGMARYLGGRIHGPVDATDTAYSKRGVIDAILREHSITGDEMVAFGDGHVEIEQSKAVGALAVAVATDESVFHSGRTDAAKRDRLMGVGADLCIPDFRDLGPLLEALGLA